MSLKIKRVLNLALVIFFISLYLTSFAIAVEPADSTDIPLVFDKDIDSEPVDNVPSSGESDAFENSDSLLGKIFWAEDDRSWWEKIIGEDKPEGFFESMFNSVGSGVTGTFSILFTALMGFIAGYIAARVAGKGSNSLLFGIITALGFGFIYLIPVLIKVILVIAFLVIGKLVKNESITNILDQSLSVLLTVWLIIPIIEGLLGFVANPILSYILTIIAVIIILVFWGKLFNYFRIGFNKAREKVSFDRIRQGVKANRAAGEAVGEE
jgi:hypothetical protein